MQQISELFLREIRGSSASSIGTESFYICTREIFRDIALNCSYADFSREDAINKMVTSCASSYYSSDPVKAREEAEKHLNEIIASSQALRSRV